MVALNPSFVVGYMEYDMMDHNVPIFVICYHIIFNYLRVCENLISVGCNISIQR